MNARRAMAQPAVLFVGRLALAQTGLALVLVLGQTQGRAQDIPPQGPPDVLYDSGEHPESVVSLMTSVESGLFVGTDELVARDGWTIVAMNAATLEVRTAGGRGDGPSEFSSRPDLIRTPGGFAAWDGGRFRLVRYSATGEPLSATTISANRFRLGADRPVAGIAQLAAMTIRPRLVGGLGDGALIFRQRIVGGNEDASRESGRLFEYLPSDTVLGLFEVPMEEVVRDASGVGGATVLFGHKTYVATLDDGIVVADTESEVVEVRARDGAVLWTFPMPGERNAVTREQVEARNAEYLEPYQGLPAEIVAQFPSLNEPMPHSPTAAPIDAVMADRDNRVWVREHVLPGAQVQRWTAWERDENVLTVVLPAGEKLLDAQGDRILVRVRDPDKDRVEVRRIAYR